MADTDPRTRRLLSGLIDRLPLDVEEHLRMLRAGQPRRPPGPSRQRILAAMVAFAIATAAIGLAAYAFLRRSEPTRPAAPRGGSIVIGSDYPECLNPITGCGSATSAWWTVLEHVLPHAMVVDEHGNWVASPLVAEAPSLTNGGLIENPFTVTYRISPDAIWDDETPITSADFEFTWLALMNTEAAYNTAGYELIESIDTNDPWTVVIRFKQVHVDWPDLFGGPYGGLLQKAAFPQYADDSTPNLAGEMQKSIPFSGGPWVLESWSTDKTVLVPNDRYYGPAPMLDQVTIIPRWFPQSTVIESILDGEIAAAQIYTTDLDVLPQLSGKRNVRTEGGDSGAFEALWFNVSSPPLDDPTVREALMYAVDRQGVVDALVKPINPNAEVLNCGFIAFPQVGPWCQTRPFEQFAYDPVKARQILESGGFDCSSTPCSRNGDKLAVEVSTVETNPRRTTALELIREKAIDAGIELRIKNYESGTLFGDIGPQGRFTAAVYSTSGSTPDPSVTSYLACRSIPTKANGFTGNNWMHWCNQRAAELMDLSDRELDPELRLQLIDEIHRLGAQDFIGLPLYQTPQITAWRADKVAGPVTAFAASPNGPFWNIDQWHVPKDERSSD